MHSTFLRERHTIPCVVFRDDFADAKSLNMTQGDIVTNHHGLDPSLSESGIFSSDSGGGGVILGE